MDLAKHRVTAESVLNSKYSSQQFDELPQDALLQALSCLHFHWRLSDRLHLAIPVLGLLVER
jgi:hypothetical protein